MDGSLPSDDDPMALGPPELLYRGLVEEIPAVVYVDSNEVLPRTLYVSPQVTDMIGFTPQEWMNVPSLWPKSIHPFDRDRVMADWRRSVETRTAFRCEYRIIRRNGSVMWVSDEGRLLLDGMGRPRCWQGVILDITDKRKALEVARNSEARYQALVEGIPAVVYEMGPDDERRTLYVSPHVEEVLGYTRGEWLDQPDIWMELLHPDDREVQLAAHDLHNETGEPWTREYRLIANDGRVVWVSDLATLMRDSEGQPRTWQGVMMDITAQKEAEEALQFANDELEFRVLARTSELAEANEMMSLEIGERMRAEQQLREAKERYRVLVERLPAVLYIWDTGPRAEGTGHYTSPMIEQLTGFTRAEWVSTSEFWADRIHPHDRGRVLAQVMVCEETGEPFRDEYRLLAKDGHVLWVHDHATLLARDDLGRPHLFQGFMLDITDRKEAEAKAQAAEERYRMLAEEGPVMAYDVILDHAGDGPPQLDVQYLSPRLQRVLGLEEQEWGHHSQAWTDAVHPDDIEHLQASFQRSWAGGDPWSDDYRMIARDGRVVWIHAEGRAVERDDLGRPTRFQGILIETTEQKESESQIRAAEERYRTIVETVPGVAWSETVDALTREPRMSFIGPQAERYFGWTAEELLAEPGHFERVLHPDDRDRVMAYAREVDTNGADEWHARYRIITRDGQVRVLDSYGAPQRDREGRIVAWHGFAMFAEGVLDVVPPGTPPLAPAEAPAVQPAEHEHAEHAPPA
jgi:PAS domain S-box-containing protein